jgi:alpha-1,2-mannosyltransferase
MTFVAIVLLLVLGLIVYKQFVKPSKHTIGVFHPYSNGGGGGEMVLWCLIRAIQQSSPESDIILYTNDIVEPEILTDKIKKTFNIVLPKNIKLVPLISRRLLEASLYPRFTLLLQSLASMIVGLEALIRYNPHVYIDSTGYAFTFVFAKVFGCKVLCYVHYPTISTDMLSRVSDRVSTHNNNDSISNSTFKTNAKLIYYQLFAKLYGIVGYYLTDHVMVNSTWTRGHIEFIWGKKVDLVYPPVSVQDFLGYPLEDRKPYILSIGQFRPEKDHKLQIESFLLFLEKSGNKTAELILLGGCRDSGDEARVQELRDLASKCDRIKFVVNATFEEKEFYLKHSLIGLHTMWNEHFGICIVEYQASGLIPLAHKSGGPLADIVVDYQGKKTGYLADNKDDYAKYMDQIFKEYNGKKSDLQIGSREISKRFSQLEFEKAVGNIILKN